jgi:hypothetical protein
MGTCNYLRRLDYYPIGVFFFFWVFAGWCGALVTADPRLYALSVVTVPTLVITALAVRALRRRHRADRMRPSSV